MSRRLREGTDRERAMRAGAAAVDRARGGPDRRTRVALAILPTVTRAVIESGSARDDRAEEIVSTVFEIADLFLEKSAVKQ